MVQKAQTVAIIQAGRRLVQHDQRCALRQGAGNQGR
jgi:hypothetical protein